MLHNPRQSLLSVCFFFRESVLWFRVTLPHVLGGGDAPSFIAEEGRVGVAQFLVYLFLFSDVMQFLMRIIPEFYINKIKYQDS